MPKTSVKPKKPYHDFPLFAHQNGQWCKKIRGKQYYFGQWNDPDSALQKYLRERDDLQAGRRPRTAPGGVDVAHMCNAFLTRQDARLKNNEISPRTFRDYREVCQLIVENLGRAVDPEQLRPIDFSGFRDIIAERYAPSRLNKSVTVTRMVLTWAHKSELIDTLPRFGPDFKGATKRAIREQKASNGEKLFEAVEIRQLLSKADTTMRAMVLLGINGGFGNTDIARLPVEAFDTEGGWVDFPRPKTGIKRRVPLWPETIVALNEAISARTTPSNAELSNRVFLTRFGNPWVSESGQSDQVSVQFRKLLQSCRLYRKGIGYYALRHTFQTIGDEAKDMLATAHIMGHADGTIGDVYRERISDERLRAVVDHIHKWIFPGEDIG